MIPLAARRGQAGAGTEVMPQTRCCDLTVAPALVIVTYAFMGTLIQSTGSKMTMTTMAMRITALLEEGAG